MTRGVMVRLSALAFSLLVAGAMIIAYAGAPVQGRSAPAVDFAKDIQPIFKNSCISCHGAEKQAGRLRLDSREAAFKGGMSGPVIIPGQGAESLLYLRVAGLEDLEQMPLKGEKLRAEQIESMRLWIAQGAPWPDDAAGSAVEAKKHWAYEKPVRQEPPPVENKAWIKNPIDHFVLARLEKEGLAPSPEAPRATLVRRVSLDLTGLPPSVEEVNAFLLDESPDAYEKLVERLLASPHYGERWARPWLDWARYADTHGYEKDRRRSMWLYRDWVIKTLNADMPFNQFTIEQMAGDLLPGAAIEQKIATGFHRNTMINEEGGVDPEEYRIAAIIDRVDTTASIWLGTTLACAQCHDHKYDPFTQEEYYRFFAFFNNTEEEVSTERGNERISRGPKVELPSPSYLSSHRRAIENEILELERILHTQTPELDTAQQQWEGETLASRVDWQVLDPIAYASAGGATLRVLEDKSVLAGGTNPARETYVVAGETLLRGITGVRLEALTHPDLPQAGSGRASNGNFILTGFEVEAAPLDNSEPPRAVNLAHAVAEYSQRGFDVRNALSEDPTKGWAVDGDKPEYRVDRQAVFVLEKPVGFEGGTRLTVRLKHAADSPHHSMGRFRLSVSTAEEPARHAQFPVRLEAVLATPPDQRNSKQSQGLSDYYRSIVPRLQPVRERLAQVRGLWSELSSPSTLVMKEIETPRATHVHLRGNFLNKGNPVTPGVPAVLHPLPEGAPPNRLTFAKWLVDENNPLVARVTVNRFWLEHFGRGLVETPEDFGTRGQVPTHPELLDWLSTEFMRQGWSLKAVHRLMVTSATYRQSSHVSPELLQRDPYNRLLARGPRFRLEAEMVRDNALAIAGLLSRRMYGPSVFPLQPEGIWNVVYNDEKWMTSTGEDRYRRGLYTFWRRTAPYPMFVTFDAPSRETTCLARMRTNTPLQALTTLNDPVFVDAARSLARRLMSRAGESATRGGAEAPIAFTIEERIIYGFQLCTARRPDSRELRRLAALFQEQLENFRQDLRAAEEFALGGDVKPQPGMDVAEFAAWTVVANVLLNLDETVTRG